MRARGWTARMGLRLAAGALALGLSVSWTPVSPQSVGREAAPVNELAEKLEIGRQGARRRVEVRSQKWIIDSHKMIDALDLPGGADVRIVQLAAGQITTVIGGKRVERVEGEWWTVPAGERLSLQTENDSAILWVLSVRAE